MTAGPLHPREAAAHVAATALRDTPVGRIGLELEFQLVDLQQVARRPGWQDSLRLAADVGPMPSGSTVTLEPGGQLELSTPPMPDVVAAVEALTVDRRALAAFLTEEGFAAVPLGADPLREPERIDPRPRYAAMQQHYTAVGCGTAGTAMMSSTAALQINLEAGPVESWAERFDWITALGPLLVAVSAGSPYLGGRTSGWASMRQQCWYDMDPSRTRPVDSGGDVGNAWAAYALDALVMLRRSGDSTTPVTEPVTFRSWLAGAVDWEPGPTTADLDYHLTTLFPPLRPRGYLELRCLDALPDRWWPGLAGFAVTLIDDPIAAAAAAEHVEPVRAAWHRAARDALGDPELARAARCCAEVVLRHAPTGLAAELESFCGLLAAGRTPADELRARMGQHGPAAVLQQEARAWQP